MASPEQRIHGVEGPDRPGRVAGPRPDHRRSRGGLVALLLGLGLALGCATPEARYRVLTIFFDDVPLPESMRPPDYAEEEPPAAPEARPGARERPVVEWVVHDPDCNECHSSKTTKLPSLPTPQLCWECHDEEDFEGDVAHGPFASGACLQCHSPHKSRNPTLLLRATTELCRGCHDASTFPEYEQHRAEEGDDCVECHDPHAAAREYMLLSRQRRDPLVRVTMPVALEGAGP